MYEMSRRPMQERRAKRGWLLAGAVQCMKVDDSWKA